MRTEEPSVALNGHYPIGKASEALGLHRNTLRRIAQEGRIKCHFSRAHKVFFTGRDLLTYWRLNS